jgi:nitroimidazol reductase NimA-like FMN-containing flavoprotein (pyridoxamine 5'-phosphate oxidase superfamily)
MSQEAAIKLLARGEYGVLSSVDVNSQPYGVPINYVFDGKDSIYFHCAQEGHKLDNLRSNPRVSFTIVGNHQIMDWKFSTAYESVILFGTAKEVEGNEKYQGLKMLAQKFSPNYMHEFEKEIEKAMIPTVVIKIKILQISGKERKLENP